MSSTPEEDDILLDRNGNAVEIETTTTSTGFFANILKRVWPSREVKYELKYKTRKASDGARSDTSSIWSKFTGFLAQDAPSSSTSSSSPRDSIMTDNDVDMSRRSSIRAQDPPEIPAQPRVNKSFAEEFKGVRTRKEVLFSREYRRRPSRNLNELYDTGVSNNANWRNGRRHENANNRDDNASNRVSLIVTSPSGEDMSVGNDEITSRTERQNYNVNEMDMGAMFRSGMGSDVRISCQGQLFQAHSFVLKAQSGHFRRVLFMKSDTKPIVINQLLPQDMEALLLYMYTRRIAKNYATRYGELTQRFQMMLEDFDVPFPDGTEPLCE